MVTALQHDTYAAEHLGTSGKSGFHAKPPRLNGNFLSPWESIRSEPQRPGRASGFRCSASSGSGQ